jgi:acyl-coenzyme A thioesterase PaaI-like protein
MSPSSNSEPSASPNQKSRLYLPTYDMCYVCGHKNPNGLQLRFYVEGEAVKTEFSPKANQLGYPGVVHGGIISAIMDEVMGWPMSVLRGRLGMTTQLQIRFLKPVKFGQTYLISAFTVDAERRLWKGRGEWRDPQGTLYVEGLGTYMPFSTEETQKMDPHLTYLPGDLKVFAPRS